MTLVDISNTLFYIALAAVILGVIVSGVGPQGFFPLKSDKKPGEFEAPRKQVIIERQDKGLSRLKRSKLLWGGLVLMLISIVITLF
ncbi:hypothetical protein E0485_14695 [Paenibacillus albiflavus]|uniref:Uncharacterized protein n=1 Tax=Paenibacillus albiflavus TaxID=2545760 RepID=A0A4R4ED58_9BACL|nr:hypothetical protein [Paenibacillus albiflavus]TCZ76091.1 hypothetical protein E0485_14695 [Paenibacillus albiflavus]